ncbi:HalOD1 output domain-containing protein [Natronolimnobius baerhuensis]|uniref:Halobacterial output domain-containing protein n=1 Tax=Natronolimnobius baerhuensis TaxID=253108 RepID=A0A202E655_9EURY|nr:HalOD1 output domain-containing protein [Natronolimnobius baerhuensis]OVE83741.1 hypothetical protein B2G88_15070 [Natronolimnobius baerhuensis]
MTERKICEPYGSQHGRTTTYDRPAGESPSIAVATALARYNDEDVTAASTQLYDYVDPEALDALFEPTRSGVDRAVHVVEFDVDGATVSVTPDHVEITSQ